MHFIEVLRRRWTRGPLGKTLTAGTVLYASEVHPSALKDGLVGNVYI